MSIGPQVAVECGSLTVTAPAIGIVGCDPPSPPSIHVEDEVFLGVAVQNESTSDAEVDVEWVLDTPDLPVLKREPNVTIPAGATGHQVQSSVIPQNNPSVRDLRGTFLVTGQVIAADGTTTTATCGELTIEEDGVVVTEGPNLLKIVGAAAGGGLGAAILIPPGGAAGLLR